MAKLVGNNAAGIAEHKAAPFGGRIVKTPVPAVSIHGHRDGHEQYNEPEIPDPASLLINQQKALMVSGTGTHTICMATHRVR
jgi:hypothetical protein